MPREKRPAQPVHMIGKWPPPDHMSGYSYPVQDGDTHLRKRQGDTNVGVCSLAISSNCSFSGSRRR